MRLVVFVALALLVGCASLGMPTDTDDLDVIRGAVCRVMRYVGGHGSGVAFLERDGWTYILTAKHVTAGAEEHPFILAYSKDGRDRVEIAEFVAKSREHDLALLKTCGSHLSVLPLALPTHNYLISDWYLRAWDEGEYGPLAGRYQWVYAVGYMNQLYPPVVSVGRILAVDKQRFMHSAASWFGSSGGPVVDPCFMCIIGINVALRVVDGMPQSDNVIALDVSAVYGFLAELPW